MQPDSNNKEKNSIGTCRRSSRTANSELIEPEMPVQRMQTYESPDGRGSNDTTLRMRESTYRREGGLKSKTDGLSSNPITLVRNVAGRDQLQAKLILRKHIQENRKAVAHSRGPKVPSRQSVPMRLGKVEMQVIEQPVSDALGASNIDKKQTPELFFARSIELESEGDCMLEGTNLTSVIDESSIQGQNLRNAYRPRSSVKKSEAAALPRENFQHYKDIQKRKIDAALGALKAKAENQPMQKRNVTRDKSTMQVSDEYIQKCKRYPMSPFRATKSSTGNRKRLEGYYRKNRAKPMLFEGAEAPVDHEQRAMTAEYVLDHSIGRRSAENDLQNNMSALFQDITINQQSDCNDRDPPRGASSID